MNYFSQRDCCGIKCILIQELKVCFCTYTETASYNYHIIIIYEQKKLKYKKESIQKSKQPRYREK